MKRIVLGSVLLCVLASSLTAAQNRRPTAARPVDAISAIIEAFRTHDVVTLGEGPHGNERGHRFRLKLVRDRRFLETVDDVLVEFGTGRQQAVMDRFINGEAIPYQTLRRVWEDTTVAGPTWERPIYREFFETVQAVNAASPKRRIRVLLGDAPIDWAAVKTRDDLRRWGIQKTQHATAVIKREVLAKQRKVLVIFGDSHLQGRGFPGDSMTTVLERQTKVFAISASSTDLAAIQPGVASWPIPSLARIRGTVIGARPLAAFYPIPPAPGWNLTRMEDQYDAVLYLGPPPRTIPNYELPPALCKDKTYMAMRLARMAIANPRSRNPGIEALKAFCAAQEEP